MTTNDAASQDGGTGTGQAATDAQQGASATTSDTTPAAPADASTTTPADGTAAGTAPAQGTQTTSDGQTAGADSTAPETFELVLPEQTTLDQTDVDALVTKAKAKGWTTAQAQVALDEWHAELAEQRRTLRTELEADPVYGGANLEASQVYARRALDFALPATTPLGQRFRAMLNKSGEGDSLLFVAAFAPLGKAMSEDTGHAHGNQSRVSQATRRSPADVLFGDAQGVVKP